jgi:hypothetical protein
MGEDISRFVTAFVETDTETEQDHRLHYDTTKHGVISLDKALTFQYENLHVSPHWKARIQGVVDSLLEDGYLTRRIRRDFELGGAIVVLRMIRALYTNENCGGTYGWDQCLNDMGALLLMACFACRTLWSCIL